MKKTTKKFALWGFILTLALPVQAQDDLSALYGTYAGSMSTTVYSEENPGGIALASKNVSFDLSKGKDNFYTLTLKGYSMANKHYFADIPLTDNYIIKNGADWIIEQENNVQGQYPTSDGKYLATFTFSIPTLDSNRILATGQMQLTLIVFYNEVKIEHVFKGKKADKTTGINNVAARSQEPLVYYDLQGRRVEKPGRGIYIVNGKKKVM